jgi:hypothetical protein
MLRERIRWEDIRSAQLAIDHRKFVVGCRKPVLVIERHGSRAVTLRGKAQVLSQIVREISPHLGPKLPERSGP